MYPTLLSIHLVGVVCYEFIVSYRLDAESAVLAVIPSVVAPSEFGDGSVFVASPDADRKSPGSTLRPSPLGRNNSARVRRVSYAVVDLILPSAIKSVGGDQVRRHHCSH